MESTQAQKNRAAAFAQEQIEAALKVIKTAQSPAEFFILKDCLENAGKYAIMERLLLKLLIIFWPRKRS